MAIIKHLQCYIILGSGIISPSHKPETVFTAILGGSCNLQLHCKHYKYVFICCTLQTYVLDLPISSIVDVFHILVFYIQRAYTGHFLFELFLIQHLFHQVHYIVHKTFPILSCSIFRLCDPKTRSQMLKVKGKYSIKTLQGRVFSSFLP